MQRVIAGVGVHAGEIAILFQRSHHGHGRNLEVLAQMTHRVDACLSQAGDDASFRVGEFHGGS
ncbi:MAG: hypothetical protein R6U98_07480 [Pirellulaceae bacterium]